MNPDIEAIKSKAFDYMVEAKKTSIHEENVFEAFIAGAMSEEARVYHFNQINS